MGAGIVYGSSWVDQNRRPALPEEGACFFVQHSCRARRDLSLGRGEQT